MDFTGFDWDEGNQAKCEKHGVTKADIESLFQRGLTILPDAVHSQLERRFKAIGETREGRYVFLAFTLRRRRNEVFIRPISARYMHKKEVKRYVEDGQT